MKKSNTGNAGFDFMSDLSQVSQRTAKPRRKKLDCLPCSDSLSEEEKPRKKSTVFIEDNVMYLKKEAGFLKRGIDLSISEINAELLYRERLIDELLEEIEELKR